VNGATEAAASSPARAPAVALVDGRGEFVRLTDAFRESIAADASALGSVWDLIAESEQRLALGAILEGRLLQANLRVLTATGAVAVQAEAVLDAAVIRHALLIASSPGSDREQLAGAAALLGDPSVDDSTAIVWIKDLDGRYLRVNRRYAERLGIDQDTIMGKSDAELSPTQVIDGKRPRDDAEPVQLEYTVEPSDGMALTVLRFPVRDLDGAPVAVCRVAALATEAGIARSEAERLLRIERWSRLSSAAIRIELLEEWQLTEVIPQQPAVPSDAIARTAHDTTAAAPELTAELAQLRKDLAAERAAKAELDARLGEELARIGKLDEDLSAAARRADELIGAEAADQGLLAELVATLEAERARVSQAEWELAGESARAGQAEQELAAERARASQAEWELAAERARASQAEQELAAGRARAGQAEREIAFERERADRAESELAGANARVVELEDVRSTALTAVGQADVERTVRTNLEQRLAQALRENVDLAHTSRAERAAAANAQAETAAARNAQAELIARADGLEAVLAGAREFEAAGRAELAQARAEIASLQGDLANARTESETGRTTFREESARLEQERHEVEQERREVEQERGKLEQQRGTLEQERGTLEQERGKLEQERRELEQAGRERVRGAQPAAPVPEVAGSPVVPEALPQWPFVRFVAPAAGNGSPSSPGPSWTHRAQRALTASIADASEWRTGLKDAIRILGAEGGWDAVIAWSADDRTTALRCGAMWTALPTQLGSFETVTWQGHQSLQGSQVGRVAVSGSSSWLADLGSVGDSHLSTAAALGIRTALLVAMRHGTETVGVLELLTRAAATPENHIVPGMEAVALQLAHFERLLRKGAEPHWRVGRM